MNFLTSLVHFFQVDRTKMLKGSNFVRRPSYGSRYLCITELDCPISSFFDCFSKHPPLYLKTPQTVLPQLPLVELKMFETSSSLNHIERCGAFIAPIRPRCSFSALKRASYMLIDPSALLSTVKGNALQDKTRQPNHLNKLTDRDHKVSFTPLSAFRKSPHTPHAQFLH